MAVGEPPSFQYTFTERKLPVVQWIWCRFAATVKIVTEIMAVFPFISFMVIVKEDDPHVSAVGLEWLDDKRVLKSSARCHIEYIFKIGKEVDSQPTVFSFTFKNDRGDFLFLVYGNAVEQ